MTDDEVLVMLSDIVAIVDYDIWKELFLDDGPETDETIDELIRAVRRHLDKVQNDSRPTVHHPPCYGAAG